MAGTNGPRESIGHTGLAQVLAAYSARGGQLLGARRRLDSPLMLTHVRWIGADGTAVEAARAQEEEALLSPEERETWVQLALDCPVVQGPMSQEAAAAWFALATAPTRASELLRLLHSGRPSGWATSQASAPISGGPLGAGYHPASAPGSYPGYASYAPTSGYGSASNFGASVGGGNASFGMMDRQATLRTMPSGGPSTSGPLAGNMPLEGLPALDGDTAIIDTPNGWTNSWQASAWQPATEAPEVTVLACVEIEMPQILAGAAGADYLREFSRDVAVSFKRMCKAIPQVRETRGWMRGNYLVLAARMAVGSGNRPPSSLETEAAAQSLATAMARETLPYNRLTLANPGEWAQGVALPS